MNTSLEELKLRTGTIARYCGCAIQTIALHCRNGELQAYPRENDRGYYSISGTAFAKYLTEHPASFYYYKDLKLHGDDEKLRETILEYIGAMPRVYTLYEFADIFGVSDRTISQWIKRGYLKSYSYAHRHSHHTIYFTDDSLHELIANYPKARKFYMEYIEKRKQANKPATAKPLKSGSSSYIF